MAELEPENFVATRQIRDILRKAKIYLQSGLPVHFTGPAGTGKTALALRLGKELEKPFYFIQGDEAFTRNELMGGPFGYYQKIVEDNFISSVSKLERKMTPVWVDNPVAKACKEGATLIYDEFTRARPEVNNVLLSVISERIFLANDRRGELTVQDVHPGFSLILTSNPREYVGVNKAQDALLDRLITVDLTGYDEETLTLITARHAGINKFAAFRIVRLVVELDKRLKLGRSIIRASIMLGKVFQAHFLQGQEKSLFFDCCRDVLRIDGGDAGLIAELWNKGEERSGNDERDSGGFTTTDH